jgi:methyl-accepting chemotaxis protein
LITLDKELGFSSTYSGLLGNWEQNIKSAENSILNERANLMKQVQNSFKTTYTTFIIIFVALILVSILLFIILQRLLTDRFRKIYEYITPLKWGEIPEEIEIKHKDEVGYLLEILNSYIKALQETAKFAQELGKGNFNYDFKPISDRDVLGNALLQLREDLKKAQEEEERRKEEERIRQWTNEGISKFAEILRQKSETIEDLARTAIKNLVNYLNANQGAFFYLNDDDPNDVYLELIATYAYSRERKKKKRFKLGEGLVGTVALEKETVYMTDIPEDYISITSGLGEANPRSLLIVPLKAEEEILGVIEIASFNEMKDYEIKFVEQIAESIAATVSITKINQRTAKLLQQSQIQAREMAAQEEEMRQNLEELKATQEEAARREAELRSLLNAIETATFVTVLDLNGFITGANDRLLERLGLTHDQYIGRHISEFDIEGTTATEEFWEKVRSGKAVHYQRHFKVNDKEFWFDEYYAAILGQEGQIQRFLAISYDITPRILQQKELEAQAQQLKEKEAKLRDQMEELEKTRKVLMKEKEHEEKLAKRLQANERILREALADIQRKSKETESFARKLAQEKAELADKYENYQSAKELINYLYKKLNKSAETEKSLIQEKDSIIEQQKQQIEQLKQEIQRLKQNNKSQPPSNNNNDSSQSSDN